MAALTSRSAWWLLIWFLLWPFGLQDDNAFSFVNPPPADSSITNPQYVVGDDINIQWVGPNDFVSIRLVQILPNVSYDEHTYVFRNITNLGGHYTWQIALNGMNLTGSNVFFFNIFIEGETSPRAVTHKFNLTQSSTTTSSASSTSTTSTSTFATTSAVSTIASAAATTAIDTPTSIGAAASMSTGAKAGIGIGASVVVVALITVGAFFWQRRRTQDDAAGGLESGQPSGTPVQAASQQTPQSEYYKPPSAVTGPSGAPTNYIASELSGSEPVLHEMADTSIH